MFSLAEIIVLLQGYHVYSEVEIKTIATVNRNIAKTASHTKLIFYTKSFGYKRKQSINRITIEDISKAVDGDETEKGGNLL